MDGKRPPFDKATSMVLGSTYSTLVEAYQKMCIARAQVPEEDPFIHNLKYAHSSSEDALLEFLLFRYGNDERKARQRLRDSGLDDLAEMI